ncbi:MAG: BTAD domain-containing putative transcriptional regulator [Gemmatimonadota bacterium]
MLRLRLFGGALLEGTDGPLGGAATQRRRIALLAVLACHPDGISRDRLVALFWPESSDERARHGLAQLLYAIRKDLGEGAIVGSATMLRLAPSALATDVNEFRAAVAAGNLEQADALYGGPFLDGFYLRGSPEFERWVEEERGRLADRANGAVERLARQCADKGDAGQAVRWWTRLAGLRPLDSRVALALVQAHVAAGDTSAALRAARTHQVLVLDQLGVAPDASLSAYVERLRSRAPAVPRPSTAPDESSPEPRPVPDVVPERSAPPGASIRATARGPASRWRRVVVGAGVAFAAAWGLFGSHGPAAGRGSSDPFWLLVADVENDTDDDSFDRTLPLLIASGLRQSSRIWVMPPERVREALGRARHDLDGPLGADLARELAVREGAALVAVPAVAVAGTGFDLSLRLLDPSSGEVLEAVARHATDRANVIDAADALLRTSRRRLGEPAISVASQSVPLPRVTTSSLEALDLYARGVRAFGSARVEDARALFEQAIALDSAFATAHAALGGLLYYINSPVDAEVHFAHALSCAEDLNWRESAFLRSSIDEWRGDRRAAVEALRPVLAREPSNPAALSRVAYNQLRSRAPAEAATTLWRLVKFDSLDANTRINLATAEKELGHYEDALRQYARAFALRPELRAANNNINLEYAGTWVYAGAPDSAAAVIAPMLDGDSNTRARGLRSMAFLSMFEGDYTRAHVFLQDAITLSQDAGQTVSEVRNRLLLASALRLTGHPTESRSQVDKALIVGRQATDPTLQFWIGRALVRWGDVGRARGVLEAIDASRHPGSLPGQAASEGLRGEILIAEGRALDGISHLERAMSLDSSALTLEGVSHASEVAGLYERAAALYSELGRGAEFGWEGQEHWRLALYRLACVEERRARHDAAVAAMRAFLDGWEGASAELIPVQDARDFLAHTSAPPACRL